MREGEGKECLCLLLLLLYLHWGAGKEGDHLITKAVDSEPCLTHRVLQFVSLIDDESRPRDGAQSEREGRE